MYVNLVQFNVVHALKELIFVLHVLKDISSYKINAQNVILLVEPVQKLQQNVHHVLLSILFQQLIKIYVLKIVVQDTSEIN